MARLAAATALLLLAACTRADPPPALDLGSLPAVRLAVQTVEVENRAQAPAGGNFIVRRRSAELAASAADYLRSRVAAVGGTDFARATVEEASLVEQARATDGGLLSLEPDWEMVGVLAVRVAVVDGFGVESGVASARNEIRRSLSKRASIEAKDSFTRQLSNDLIAAAGRDLDRSIQQNLAAQRAP